MPQEIGRVVMICARQRPFRAVQGCASNAPSWSARYFGKRAAVMRPVGRFESSWRKIGDAAVGRINGDRFERAVESRLASCGGSRLSQLDVREHGFFHHILVVGTYAEPDVERALQRNAQPTARHSWFAV